MKDRDRVFYLNTPVGLKAGTYQLKLEATSPKAKTSSINVTIRVMPPLAVITEELPTLTIGRYFEAWIEAFGGAGNYTFGAVDLPPGIRIAPKTGKIYSEEDNHVIEVGLYYIKIQVRDANGALAEKILPLEVYVDTFAGPGMIPTPKG